MNRQRSGSISGSPVLIGAVTVIVTIVAVFLSYNANEGLPFVPTYSLTAEVPNASGLVQGNEVRMGGTRVGVVTEIKTAPQKANGDVTAHLSLELDERVVPLPADSTIIIRPRSALGLKFVELTKGRSEQGFEEGETIPLTASQVETKEIDDFFNMFDDPTRQGSQTNLATGGAGLAGRGESLNRAFAQLGPLAEKLEPAMRNLAAPRTGWAQLFPALAQAAAEVAPIAGTQASLWAALDTTFTAWAGVSDSLQETISEGPPSMEVAINEFPRQRPFLRDSEELFRRFRPAFASLAAAAPDLATAFRVGEPALLRSPGLNRRLTRTLDIVDRFGDDERVPSALARLTSTMQKLRPTLAFLTPMQTECNYGTLLFRNLASATSEGDVVGSMLRVAPMGLPQDRPQIFIEGTDTVSPSDPAPIGEFPNNESGPASAPANGPVPPAEGNGYIGRQRSLSEDSFLHSNPYSATAAPGQGGECEAGNDNFNYQRVLRDRQVIGNVPGNPGRATEDTVRKGVR